VPYLSSMLRKKIESEEGEKLGRLEDVVISEGMLFPSVKGIMISAGRVRKRRQYFIPWSAVKIWGPHGFTVGRGNGRSLKGEDILLARDLLDKQIVDMNGYKIVRVSDLVLSRAGNQLRVIGANVGVFAILRRLGFSDKTRWLASRFGMSATERVVPWHLMSPVGPMPYDVRLKVPFREYLQMHPSDIADIIEQLDVGQRAKVLALIDNPKAARVLAHMIPKIRSSVAESIDDTRLGELLDIMPPDEAADIIGSLPRDKATTLLSLMGIDEAAVVSELLGYEPTTAGGRMTTEFVSVPKSRTAQEIIDYLREVGPDAETIYYVFVVDDEGRLTGVLSLRDLLRSPPWAGASDIMVRDVITTNVYDDQEEAADKLSRYNLLALPVVDDDYVLKGILTVDDAIDVLEEEFSEDISRISGVPLADKVTPVHELGDLRRWAGTVITFLGGLLSVVLFGIFKKEFVAALALIYFVPLALRLSHDASVWSLAVALRRVMEKEEGAPPGRLLARESVIGAAAGALAGLLGFGLSLVWTDSVSTAVAGSVGIFVGISLTSVLGVLVTAATKRLNLDPAVGPGRLAGVSVMAVSVIAFLAVSGLLASALV
jgi:magnesium transporter